MRAGVPHLGGLPGQPCQVTHLRGLKFSPWECLRWGGVIFSWAFIHYKTNWTADGTAKNVKFNAQYFGYGRFSLAHKHKHKHKHNIRISKCEHPRHKHKHSRRTNPLICLMLFSLAHKHKPKKNEHVRSSYVSAYAYVEGVLTCYAYVMLMRLWEPALSSVDWRFRFEYATCGRGYFWIRKEKLRIKKYPDTCKLSLRNHDDDNEDNVN